MCQAGMERNDPVSRNVAHHGRFLFPFKLLGFFVFFFCDKNTA